MFQNNTFHIIYLYIEWMVAFAVYVVGFKFSWGQNFHMGAVYHTNNVGKTY